MQKSDAKKFIVGTEPGILHQMKKVEPDKLFIEAPPQDEACACNECTHMKLNTLEKVYLALRDLLPQVGGAGGDRSPRDRADRTHAVAFLSRSPYSRRIALVGRTTLVPSRVSIHASSSRGDTMHTIHIVSGGTGASADQLVRTVLAQFDSADVDVRIAAEVRDVPSLLAALRGVDVHRDTVVHTLVSEPMRKELVSFAEKHGLVAIDLVGSLMDRLSWALDLPAAGMPGRYRQLRSEYFTRMDAIEYAVDHDDGRNADDWPSADVLLLGPSRVGKTPACVFLATQGWKAANLPIVRGVQLPSVLFEVPVQRIVGLTIRTDRLFEHRVHRAKRLGLSSPSSYEDPAEVEQDMRYARDLFRRSGFVTVDATDKPVEELVREVMERVRR